RFEIFVAACSPETAFAVNHQRMADPAAKDSRTICSSVDHASPRTFFRMSSHVALDFADELLEEPGPITCRRLERFGNRAAQHGIGWRVEDARLEICVLSH